MCKPVIPYFILGRIIKSSKTELVSVKELVWVTSLLVTDVGDEMGWWQLHDVGDNFMRLVTVLVIWIIHYLFTLASSTNIQKMSPRSKFCHQHPKIVNNLKSSISLSLRCWSSIFLWQRHSSWRHINRPWNPEKYR